MHQDRNHAIDVAKFVAALMVIAVHTGLFSDVDSLLYFVVVNILCRQAVPFFAICTGYFMGRKLTFGDKLEGTADNRAVFRQQLKRVAGLYAVWTVLYLLFSIPVWRRTGWFSFFAFVDYAVAALTAGSHYHMWYMLYILYSLPLLYLLLRWVAKKYQWWLIAGLWFLAVFSYVYKDILPVNLAALPDLLNRFSALPVLLPFLLLGVQISREEEHPRRSLTLAFAAAILLLTAEAFLLRQSGAEKFSYIVFTLPVAYFLFHIVRGMRITSGGKTAALSSLSVFIYCVHPMIIETVGVKVDSTVARWGIVTAIAVALSVLYDALKRRIKGKKVFSCFN